MSATTKKKYVEQEMYDYALPEDHQTIVRVLRARGNNLHEVRAPNGEEFIVSMPPKFRKHVWIKRGSYLVTEPIPEGNKVRAEIVRVLLKDQIRYIMQHNKWPAAFGDEACKVKRTSDDSNRSQEENVSGRLQRVKVNSDSHSERDSDSDDDDLLMENPNRRRVHIDDSDSSESEATSDDDSDADEQEYCGADSDGD